MKRSSMLYSSSARLASSSQQPSQKPWLILHRLSCHPSSEPPDAPIQSQTDRWASLDESPFTTWRNRPRLPSVQKHGMPKLLPKLMHPFNVSMFTPPLSLQPQSLDPTPTTMSNASSSHNIPSFWSHKEDPSHKNVDHNIAMSKIRRLLRLAHLDVLKDRLDKETHDVITINQLLNICITTGVASSPASASLLVQYLEDGGFIFVFQDLVYLKPKKIAQQICEIIPIPLSASTAREKDLQELSRLKEEKDEIDSLAYNHSRKVLWLGFGYLMLQMALMFRFTFWELSWDVMEPIAYFTANITLLLGYAFYMITSKHPTYQDLTTLLISSKQAKLIKARKFNIGKLLELQNQIGVSTSFLKERSTCHY